MSLGLELRSKAIPLRPVADAGGGRENGAEADGALGDQHDDALSGVRQFACAGKHSGSTGSRRLTNATGNKQAAGRKQGEMIRGKNWDKGLKRKDQSRSSFGQSNGLSCLPSPLAHAKRLVEPDVTMSTRFRVPWPDTRVRHPCKRRSTNGFCGCPTADPPKARPGRPASRLRRFRACPPDSGPRRRSGLP